MEREIIITTDGSHSISIPEMGVTYHSSHGAIQESMHVFVESGMRYINQENKPGTLSIFEMGFGTGLNALLALAEAEKNQQPVYYETLELYPLERSKYELLNYCEQLQRPDLIPLFSLLHSCEWNVIIKVTPWFSFKKINSSLLNHSTIQLFNLVFFDAFAPEKQPELWTTAIFKKLHDHMLTDGVLTTYCSKSIVRKSMAEAGFTIEKIPGPPHKREMVRAVRY